MRDEQKSKEELLAELKFLRTELAQLKDTSEGNISSVLSPQREQTLQALFYRGIVEDQTELISRFLPDGTLTFVNDAYCRFHGKSREDLVGQTFWHHVHEDDRSKVKAFLDSFATNNVVKTVEHRVMDNRGDVRYLQWTDRAFFDESRRLIGFQGVGSDISERRRAEEALRKLQAQLANALEMARLGPWEYDIASDRFTFNDYFYSMFRTTAKQAGGYTMSSSEYASRFVHPDDISVVREEIRKAIEANDPDFSSQLDHRILYEDGSVGTISVRFFIVKDALGQTIKTYGVNQDITGAFFLTLVLQMATLYVPFLNPIFKTEPLTLYELGLTLALSSVVFFAVEIEKWTKRWRMAVAVGCR